jgi:hypothetical protein
VHNLKCAQLGLCASRIMHELNFAQIELGASPIMRTSNYAQVGFDYAYGPIDTYMPSSTFEIQIPAHWNRIG